MADIAVIGMGCWYPGARDLRQLWENVLARRQQFRTLPNGRLPLADYYDPNPAVPDKTYGKRAAVIDGFAFDWAARRVPKLTYETTDIVHWLAMETALAAISDAGFTPKTIPSEKTAVILGNTLTGEFTRSNVMRLRWPFVRRTLRAAAGARGLSAEQVADLETTMEAYYKSVFAPVTEDTLAGALSNTIAGRIANVLNLDGGNYTVDGACSSSLISVATAAQGLESGDLDLALAGGVDVSLDTFELIGFAKAGALSKDDMNVYDRRGAGFIPGEGCGFVVLKRLADARRDGNRVYAVVKGWGISSDGRGGITAPNSLGQAKALTRAYRRAQYSAGTLHFIEGHGTGTKLGDKTELEGVVAAVTADGPLKGRTVGMTSFKSIVGHTKAAAGVGGFIKAVCAVNRRVIPPTAGCREPHPIFADAAHMLFPVLRGEVHAPDVNMRAGVSAMGFGGINCHITLESGDPPDEGLAPRVDERALVHAQPQTELYCIDAASVAELRTRIEAVRRMAAGAAPGDGVDLASALAAQLHGQSVRAAIVAQTPEELVNKLGELEQLIGQASPERARVTTAKRDIWLSLGAKKARVGFLFPGQGSQRVGMASALVERFPFARGLLARFDAVVGRHHGLSLGEAVFRPTQRASDESEVTSWERTLAQTEVAQPAIAFASVCWFTFLQRLGIAPSAVAGHSLGELTAFYAAGVIDEPSLIQLVKVRGEAMAAPAESAGAMASLACDEARARALLQGIEGYAVIANLNSPTQTVVSGERKAIESVIARALAGTFPASVGQESSEHSAAESRGIQARALSVSNAFHSRLVEASARRIRAEVQLPAAGVQRAHLLTGVTGTTFVGTDLTAHFADQVLAQVNFVQLAHALAQAVDLVIEVGPGRVLTGLFAETVGDGGPICLPVEARPSQDADFNAAVGALFVHGHDVKWQEFFASRLVRPFVAAADRLFITNPLELPLQGPAVSPVAQLSGGTSAGMHAFATQLGLSAGELSTYLSHRGGFLADVIRADLRSAGSTSDARTDVGVGAQTTSAALLPLRRAPNAESPRSTPTAAAGPSIEEMLIERVASRTGYPPNTITLELRLLDDLNMDSIKAGEVIGAVATQAGVAGAVDPAGLANATLADVAAAIRAQTAASPTIAGPGVVAPGPSRQQVSALDTLLDLVAKRTGFPVSTLSGEMRLLDDLNLDSIKAAEVIGGAARALSIEGLDGSALANGSLAQIAEALEQAATKREASEPSQSGPMLELILAEFARMTAFPRGQFGAETKPTDLPDFDRDKLARLLRSAAAQAGIQASIDVDGVLGKSLGDIARILTAIETAKLQREREPAEPEASWSRSFVLELVETPRQKVASDWQPRHTDRWSEVSALILVDASDKSDCADLLRERITTRGGTARIVEFESEAANAAVADASHSVVIALLPRTDAANGSAAAMVRRLRLPALVPPASAGPRRWSTVAYLQACGGRFGRDTGAKDCASTSAVSFAASLHHERSDLRVRVVDVARALPPAAFADAFLDELTTSHAYEAVGFDAQLVRRTMRPVLVHPSTLKPRGASWSSADVVLVTGGAKGITAECALAFARSTGARMALLGSSGAPVAGDAGSAELARTLERFREQNLIGRYYRCDVTDAASVNEVLARVEQELGAVTAVIHGAGVNTPRRVAQSDERAAQKEIAPKLAGMLNLVTALGARELKLFCAFTSIIGVTGMPGNAWYAYSNESVDLLLRDYQARHPNTETCSLAYSVWGEVGMGAKLGSVKQLSKVGIGAIEPQEGVARFLAHVRGKASDSQCVVTARLGGLDTWQPHATERPAAARYLEEIVRVAPGVEAVARSHLTLTRDPYLVDHLYNGSYLFPTVFGLEAMAQVVAAVTGRTDFHGVAIEDIRLERPIVVDPDRGAHIEVRALVVEGATPALDTVRVSVFAEVTGYTKPHFAAVFSFAEQPADPIRLAEASAYRTAAARAGGPTRTVALDPKRDLYGGLLFQGPLFQRIAAVDALDGRHCVFRSARRADATQVYLLGDPYFRDALLQAGQLVIPRHLCLPVAVARWRPDVRSRDANDEAVAILDGREQRNFRASVHAFSSDGELTESIEGYLLRILEERPNNPAAEELARPSSQDGLRLRAVASAHAAKLDLTLPSLALAHLSGDGTDGIGEPNETQIPMIQGALRDAIGPNAKQLAIDWIPGGRPRLVGAPVGIELVVARDGEWLLCVFGGGHPGCGLRGIAAGTREEWLQRLPPAMATLLDELVRSGETHDAAYAYLQAVADAHEQAAGTAAMSVARIQRRTAEALVIAVTGADGVVHEIFACAFFPVRGPRRVVAVALPAIGTAAREERAARNGTEVVHGTHA